MEEYPHNKAPKLLLAVATIVDFSNGLDVYEIFVF
jgi:hypothetical protein